MKTAKKFLSILSIVVFAFDVKNHLVLGDSIGHGSGLKNPEEASFGKIVADSNGMNSKTKRKTGLRSRRLRSPALSLSSIIFQTFF